MSWRAKVDELRDRRRIKSLYFEPQPIRFPEKKKVLVEIEIKSFKTTHGLKLRLVERELELRKEIQACRHALLRDPEWTEVQIMLIDSEQALKSLLESSEYKNCLTAVRRLCRPTSSCGDRFEDS